MNQISVNYAIALYRLSLSEESVRESKQLLEATPELWKVLKSPVISYSQKHRIIDRIFPKDTRNFIKVVCDNQDVDNLLEIFAAYDEYACEKKGILRAKVFCITKPDENQISGIRQYLMERYHKQEVQIELEVDTELLGGFIIQVGDRELDWSLRGRLEQLRRKIMWR